MLQNIDSELTFFSCRAEEPTYNKYVAEQVISFANLNPHSKILDAGCGGGYWGRKFALCGHRSVGVDLSESMISLAEKKAVKGQSFVVGNIGKPLALQNDFDVLLFGGIFHHFPCYSDLEQVLCNLSKHLKGGGKLILIEPNGSNPVVKVSRIVGRLLGKFTNLDIATENETMHSVRRYRYLLKKHGYIIKKIGMLNNYIDDKNSECAVDSVLMNFMLAIRKLLYRVTWKSLPKLCRGNEVVIIAKLPL